MSSLLGIAIHFLQRQFRSIPVPTTSYAGRTVIVTGANSGLGLEAARHFARLGAARVILACRSTDKAEAAKADIERSVQPSTGVVEVWPLDLCSFESVRAFCRRAEHELDRLDVLVANAAVAMADFRVEEGYETTVTVNVISTFLLVFMLLPLVKRTAARFNVEPCVSVVASEAHFFTKFVEKDHPSIFESLRGNGSWYDRYGTTKLLEVLVVRELGERLNAAHAGSSPVVVNTTNPGLCRSNLFRNAPSLVRAILAVPVFLIGRTAEQGSRALLAGAAAGPQSQGQYVDSGTVEDPSPFILSEEGKVEQKRVWDELINILERVEPGVTGNVTK